MSTGGKGSRPRPFSVSQSKFADNWDQIFSKKEKNVEPTTAQVTTSDVAITVTSDGRQVFSIDVPDRSADQLKKIIEEIKSKILAGSSQVD